MKFISLFLLLTILYCTALWADNLNFTKEEKEWIQNHESIRVANESDWPPFDFYESEKPKGLIIDHIKLLTRKIGIQIEFVSTKTRAELLELFKQKKIDLLPGIYRNSEREKYIHFTQPYYRGTLGIFTNTENKTWDNDDLYKKRIGIEGSHGSIARIKKQVPGIVLFEVENNIELVRQLATKKLDAIIGNPLQFYYYSRENQINNIQLSDFFEMNETAQENTSLHIGIRKDWPILHRILKKTMQHTTEKEMEKIKRKWTEVTIIEQINWGVVILVFVSIILILCLLLWHNKILQSRVERKTEDFRKLNESLELKVESRTKELLKLNKELEKIAHTDPLTNAYNRRYFFEVIKQIISLAKREKQSLTLAMIDLDKFKNINDSFGHDIGDKVIQVFVQEVNKVIRTSDILTRFGGEEFVVLFPNTTLEGALTTAEKIRCAIEACEAVNEVRFTVSIGISQWRDDEVRIKDTITRADKAVYQAKDGGRNRVEFVS